jgi:DNA polymerase II large subunit
MEANKEVMDYFDKLDKEMLSCYDIANDARSKGYDPEEKVEIVLAKNLAERVVGLISTVAPEINDRSKEIVKRIESLEEEFGNQDWRVALKISEEIAKEKFCKFEEKKKAIETGIRFGIAYITVGVVASPLEGFTKVEFKQRRDGKEYFSLYFSGPMRSAGGTGASVSVVIADYVRIVMGYDVYDPEENEIKRMCTELRDYHERVTNLQYFPSEEEISFMVKNLTVQIDGDPSEKFEVSNYKDLDRIDTNVIRNGVCLVLGEGLCQKAPKVWKQLTKWGKDFKLKHWEFLEEFLKIQKKIKAKGNVSGDKDVKISPDYTFIKDIVAGRPVLSHPLAKGGFRLRYGRTRLSGFSSNAIHPATMLVLENYIASGTQLKMERPGKATVVSSCDSIEGPIVRLKNDSVVYLKTIKLAKKYVNDIEEVLFLGDMLINYGDFFNRAHKLATPGYCEEWWLLEFEKKIQKKGIVELSEEYGIDRELLKRLFKGDLDISGKEAVNLSEKLKINLHPKYTYHWKEIDKNDLISLYEWISNGSILEDPKKIILPFNVIDVNKPDPKRILELLGVEHNVVSKEHVVIEEDHAVALSYSLNLKKDFELNKIIEDKEEDVLKLLCKNSNMRDKSGIFIGARMGRPEKAKMRKMTGSPHVLFPVGDEGGRLRCFQSAIENGKIKGDFPIYNCSCGHKTIFSICEKCGSKPKRMYYCIDCNLEMEKKCEQIKKYGNTELPHNCNLHKNQEIQIEEIFRLALSKLKLSTYPELIKGVRGTSNDDHFPENLCKGVLRAMEDVYVNKDGTIRYDMTEMTITHFKPKEIGTSIEKLKELGYSKDVNNNELISDDQVIEILPQDIILPACDVSPDEPADEVLFRISKFIDNLLTKFYGLKSYYNLKTKEDIVGHLVLGMSPHTSAGILGRIIGFSKLQGFLTHPLMHSIMRRDCDGDEACVVLLMDALINFSKKLLPSHRGSKQDAPLVLTTRLIPKEVDDMIFDIDVVWKYPLEFYEACENWKDPWDIKIEQLNNRLGTEKQYEDYGYTHEVSDFNLGIRCSSYKSLPTMKEKVYGQMRIAEKTRAVDENDVARLVIERHFIRDIRGNLRKFSQQQFRCVKCNTKYRRPPLMGKCLNCKGKILFTISEGSIVKYVEPAMSLADKYDLPVYLKQSLQLTQNMIESTFSKDPEKQEGLGKWF